jgi:hypothetical protein
MNVGNFFVGTLPQREVNFAYPGEYPELNLFIDEEHASRRVKCLAVRNCSHVKIPAGVKSLILQGTGDVDLSDIQHLDELILDLTERISKEVSLSHPQEINKLFVMGAEQLTDMKNIIVGEMHMLECSFNNIIVITGIQGLTTLVANRCHLGDKEVDILVHTPSIKILDVRDNVDVNNIDMTGSILEAFSFEYVNMKGLAENKTLTSIRVNAQGRTIYKGDLPENLERLRVVKSTDFTLSHVSKSLELIGCRLGYEKILPLSYDFSSLEYLDLSRTQLNQDMCKQISKANKLRTLNLVGSGIDDIGLSYIFSKNTTITHLDIWDNKIKSTAVYKYLPQSITHLHLPIINSRLLKSILERNKYLVNVDCCTPFKKIKVCNKSIMSIKDVIVSTRNIVHEMLRSNYFGYRNIWTNKRILEILQNYILKKFLT